MRLRLFPHMNRPPDKKRKTDPVTGDGAGKAEDEDWGDDITTEEMLMSLCSDTEVQKADSTQPDPTYSEPNPPGLSQSTSRAAYQRAATASSISLSSHLDSRSEGRQSVSRSSSATVPSRPIPQFQDDLQNCLKESEKQVTAYEAKLLHLGDELTQREGEVALQRQTIEQKEAEILKYKQEKMGQLEADRRERSMKEKQLEMEVERLRSQVQFKEHEVAEVVSKCKSLEQKLAHLEGGSSPVKLSTQPPKVHPVRRKSPLKSPPSEYPTIESFHARDLPESGDRNDSKTSTDSTGIEEDAMESSSETSRNQRLASTVPNGEVSGPHLVCRLLVDSDQLHVDSSHASGGILKLMMPRSRTPVNLSTVDLEREGGSLLFSPKHIRRSHSQQRSTSRSQAYLDSSAMSPGKTAVKNVSLATVGVSSMLAGHYTGEDLSSLMGQFPEELEEAVETHGAIFLLPLIEDCLQEYSRMLSNIDNDSFSTPRTSSGSLFLESGSSSDRSSFYSFSSSLNGLLREGATYANNLEEITLAALNVLYELVSHCPHVVKWILSRVTEEKKSPTSKNNLIRIDIEKQEPVAGTSKEVTSLPDSSPKLNPISDFSGLQTLDCVIRLADCGVENSLLHRQSVVELCLDILNKLCVESSVTQVESLSSVITGCVIHTCLVPEVSSGIVRRALQLLKQLAKSSAVLKTFCTASDGCVWMSVYGLCTSKSLTQSADRSAIYSSIIDCLSTVVSRRKHGISKLLDTSCVCNSEVIKAVTLSMGNLLDEYVCTRRQETLDLMKRGVTFLHVLSQSDARLSDRRDDTIHNYVALVSGLQDLYKQLPGITDNEFTALQELWEFVEEGSGDSQMDTG